MEPLQHSAPSNGAQSNQSDAAARAAHQQVRAHLENQLRIKKLEIADRNHKIGDIERALLGMDGEVHHIMQDVHRVEGELHQIEIASAKENRESKEVEGSIREKESELHRRSDESMRLEHEIAALRQQITDKERKIHELREETRDLMRGKEEFRREYEIDRSSAISDVNAAHEKNITLQRYKQDLMRKQSEMEHKKQEEAGVKRDLIFKEQDVAQLEAELRRE